MSKHEDIDSLLDTIANQAKEIDRLQVENKELKFDLFGAASVMGMASSMSNEEQFKEVIVASTIVLEQIESQKYFADLVEAVKRRASEFIKAS